MSILITVSHWHAKANSNLHFNLAKQINLPPLGQVRGTKQVGLYWYISQNIIIIPF